MSFHRKFRSQKSAGFSLIELLVVVGIIGILSAVALPQYEAYKGSAAIAAGAGSLKAMASEYRGNIAANIALPANITALAADVNVNTTRFRPGGTFPAATLQTVLPVCEGMPADTQIATGNMSTGVITPLAVNPC